MRQKLLLTFFLITLCFYAVAQNRVVTGQITDQNKEPLPGATVIVIGTSTGAVADVNGQYSLSVDPSASPILSFQFMGMQTQEIAVNTREVINVTMSEGTQDLEEVFVIGYGTVKRKELTGAAAQVKGEDLVNNSVSSDMGAALQGMIAGVSVSTSSSEPGSSANIQIRGISSMSGDNTPLYVVDGIPQDGDPMLNVNEIEQIDVLKDAASCAIYGTRGAAGVILITTKQGESGKLKVNASMKYSLQSVDLSGLPELMNSEQQAYFKVIQASFEGSGEYDSINVGERYYFTDNDIFDILVTDIAVTKSADLTILGGGKDVTFSILAGYYNQDGMMPNSAFDRFNFRSNLVYKGNRLSISLSPSMMYSRKTAGSSTSIQSAIKKMPYTDVSAASSFDSIDSYVMPVGTSESDAEDFLDLLESFLVSNETDTFTATLALGLDYKVNPNLTLNSKFGFKVSNVIQNVYKPPIAIYDTEGTLLCSADDSNSSYKSTFTQTMSYNANVGANYTKKWSSGHSLSAMGAVSYEEYTKWGFSAYIEDLIVDGLEGVGYGQTDAEVSSVTGYDNKLAGIVARLMYNYKSRYILSVSSRADASSKFSAENRWGFFPSLSAGWNISDESFWKPVSNIIKTFKLRASVGTTGNQSVTSYSYSSYLSVFYDYADGDDNLNNGLTSITYYNPDLKWETSLQYNVGFDFGFLNNKLQLSLDYYNTQKKDMLAEVQLPSSAGAGSGSNATIMRNIGNMTNNGIEATLSYNLVKGDFRMRSQLNISHNQNVVTSLGDDNTIIYNDDSTVGSGSDAMTTVFAEGYEAGAFFLLHAVGVANTQEKLEAYQKIVPDAVIGDMMYADINGDNVIDSDDRIYCGSGSPDVEFGLNLSFSYKNIDLSTNWYASVGNKAINVAEVIAYQNERSVGLLSSWSYANTDSETPAFRDGSSNYIGYSDIWIEDASYIRMKTISIGYTINNKIWKSLSSGTSFRFYISGQNLLTFTKYSGMDPDIGGNGLTTRGIDSASYPSPQTYLIGLDVKF